MADIGPSTYATSPEDDGFTPSPVAANFFTLLGALAQHVETERALVGKNVWDPAVARSLFEAETAQGRVAHLLAVGLGEDVVEDGDKPLVRMSMLIDALIGSEQPNAFKRYRPLLNRYDSLFRCQAEGPAGRWVDWMLETARERIDDLAGLEVYASVEETGRPAEFHLAEMTS